MFPDAILNQKRYRLWASPRNALDVKSLNLKTSIRSHFIVFQHDASSVVELWFAAADFPKGAVGADVVTGAALIALLFDLQFAVWEKRHRDFAVTCSFRHEYS